MSDQTKPTVMNELRATAQLMTLEPGVFCVFHQGPVVTDSSGLPGVRISLPPGLGHMPGSVQISTFRDDGWLGGADSAALIRINGNRPGQVLVTVYQAQNGTDAPRLQVVRLTGVPTATAAQPGQSGSTQGEAQNRGAPGAAQGGTGQGVAAMLPGAGGSAAERPRPPENQPPADKAEVSVHINRMGDVLALFGDWAGERGSKRWIEGFALSPRTGLDLADVEYQAVLGRDWLSPWSEGGQYCGSRGMSLPLLGLRVRLRGAAAEQFDLALEASFVNGTTVGPVGAGEACETPDLAALEAFKLIVTPRAASGKPARAAAPAVETPAATGRSGRGRAAGGGPAAAARAETVQAEPLQAETVRSEATKSETTKSETTRAANARGARGSAVAASAPGAARRGAATAPAPEPEPQPGPKRRGRAAAVAAPVVPEPEPEPQPEPRRRGRTAAPVAPEPQPEPEPAPAPKRGRKPAPAPARAPTPAPRGGRGGPRRR